MLSVNTELHIQILWLCLFVMVEKQTRIIYYAHTDLWN